MRGLIADGLKGEKFLCEGYVQVATRIPSTVDDCPKVGVVSEYASLVSLHLGTSIQ